MLETSKREANGNCSHKHATGIAIDVEKCVIKIQENPLQVETPCTMNKQMGISEGCKDRPAPHLHTIVTASRKRCMQTLGREWLGMEEKQSSCWTYGGHGGDLEVSRRRLKLRTGTPLGPGARRIARVRKSKKVSTQVSRSPEEEAGAESRTHPTLKRRADVSERMKWELPLLGHSNTPTP